MNKIWFDMDGTIADFYNVDGWLNYLLTESAYPYKAAAPLLNLNKLARILNILQKKGYQIGIISWSSKNSTPEFDEKVKQAKMWWLNKHLTSVKWDVIHIVPYGTHKHNLCGGGILFDDEEQNRVTWTNGKAYKPEEILKVLQELNAA